MTFGDERAPVVAADIILDSLGALVWAVRPDGEVCYGNRRWWDYSGLSAGPGTVTLDACLQLVHPEDRTQAEACWYAALDEGETGEVRHRLRRASDDSHRWHVCRVLPLATDVGDAAGWVMVATDIHDLMTLAVDNGGPPDLDDNVRRVRAMMRDAPVPLALFEGPRHRCVFANDAASQAVRAVTGDREGGSFPELDSRVRALFDEVYTGGERRAVRSWPVRARGGDEGRLFDFVLQPTRDATGNVFGIVGAGNDVTDSVRARRALEEGTLRLTRVEEMAAALGDVLDCRRAGRIVAEQMREAAGARSCTVTLCAGERTEVLAASGDSAGDRCRVVIPLGVARPLGEVELGLSAARAIDEHERRYLEALARHGGQAIERALLYQTAERAREEATVQRERLLRLIHEAPTPVAIFRGPDLLLELANPRWEALFHRGRPVATEPARTLDPPLDGRLLAAMHEVFRSGVGDLLIEVEVPPADDERRGRVVCDVTVQPFREVGGEVAGMTVVAVEVTEQARVRRTTQVKDEFLALLGHELRNPLAPIVVALQLLRMRGAADQVRELGIIERQVHHLVRLVDDLLDVSRITRGMIRLRRERVELATVVSRAVEMASPLLEQREHHLVVDVPATGCPLLADRERLAQVIANLLTNAAKYTQPHGDVRVTTRRLAGEDAVVVSVRDNGRGMPPELLAVVFDMFVQGNRPIDRSEGGLGLGLTLVRTLVELHGGTVSAHSGGVGAGSEFLVRLPLAAEAPAPAEPARAASPEGAAGRRVLVVDDNGDVVEVMSELLRLSGYEVAIAHDAPEALRVATRFDPEVAVLDIGLPVMDGYELARRLRLANPAVRLVAVTGYGQPEDRERSRAAGFQEHLVKPIEPDMLLAAIDAKPL
jgi:signal transduction histidine kinase